MARGQRDFQVKTKRRSFDLPKTWGEFKAAVEDAGVTDDDRIFMIDVGPDAEVVLLERDEIGVEITGGSDASPIPNARHAGGPTTGEAAETGPEGQLDPDLRTRREGSHRATRTGGG